MDTDSGIEKVLRQFQDGDCTESDVADEVDRVLNENPQQAGDVLRVLDDVTGSNEVALRQLVRSRVERSVSGVHDPAAPTGTQQASALQDDEATRIYVDDTRMLEPGDEIGPVMPDGSRRFVLTEKVGAGGMSIIFKAKDKGSYREPTVAVKVLNPEFSKHDDAFIAIARETAKSRELIECSNIVSVYDGGVDGPHAYMWMDYLPGRSLSERLKEQVENPLSKAEAHLIIEGMARGLSYAHRKEQIHSDFKPGNVMLANEPVTSPDDVKIIDFGISRAFRRADDPEADATIFNPGTLNALTPAYASPEMLEQMNPDPRDDIYALACIAYEVLTGRHPFDRTRATEARNKGLAPDAQGLDKRELRALKHGLAFNRDDRTASVDEFIDELAARRGPRPQAKPVDPDVKRMLWPVASIVGVIALGVLVWSQRGLFTSLEVGEQFSECWSGCPTVTVLPNASFSQGSNDSPFVNERPARTVEFAAPFALGVNEVTVDEFAKFAAATGHSAPGCEVYTDEGHVEDDAADWRNPGFAQAENHPVTCVSWADATAYASWLAKETGAPYRLPSASELEYAVLQSASADTPTCAIGNVADETAVTRYPGWLGARCSDGVVHTAPVGQYQSSPHGLNDLHGNVMEWARDCWHESYFGAPTDGSAWTNTGDCSLRATRGGSWLTQPDLVYASFRNRLPSDTRVNTVGFRVARDIDKDEIQ